MALYEITDAGLRAHAVAQFAALGVYERADLQRLLRDLPEALGEDLLMVAEEFGNWEDSRRRIDLLALDPTGKLVVIELKRTDDGGHMELQALRYAAMVSSMSFDDVAAAFVSHRAKLPADNAGDPRAELERFLDPTGASDGEPAISTDVRIVLVAADFGREITTAVLWLNRFEGMDIRCVRLVPYQVDTKILLDIQQVIPLPAAADYQVRVRSKEAARERFARLDSRDFTRFHIVVDGVAGPAENKRNAVRNMVASLVENGVRLASIQALLPARAMRSLPGILHDPSAVAAALASDPTVDVRRWFTDYPMPDVDEAKTYVLWKMWGLDTEPTLRNLADAFPASNVTVQRAGPSA